MFRTAIFVSALMSSADGVIANEFELISRRGIANVIPFEGGLGIDAIATPECTPPMTPATIRALPDVSTGYGVDPRLFFNVSGAAPIRVIRAGQGSFRRGDLLIISPSPSDFEVTISQDQLTFLGRENTPQQNDGFPRTELILTACVTDTDISIVNGQLSVSGEVGGHEIGISQALTDLRDAPDHSVDIRITRQSWWSDDWEFQKMHWYERQFSNSSWPIVFDGYEILGLLEVSVSFRDVVFESINQNRLGVDFSMEMTFTLFDAR